jgi:hypothetical protein
MSKGQQRSNREQKKPKQNKQKLPATTTTSPIAQIKPNPLIRGKAK